MQKSKRQQALFGSEEKEKKRKVWWPTPRKAKILSTGFGAQELYKLVLGAIDKT